MSHPVMFFRNCLSTVSQLRPNRPGLDLGLPVGVKVLSLLVSLLLAGRTGRERGGFGLLGPKDPPKRG